MRRWSAVLGVATAVTMTFSLDASAALVVYRLDATTVGLAQFNGFLSFTDIDVTATAPAETSLNPGDTLEIDFFAPVGEQFVVSTPPGGTLNIFSFSVSHAPNGVSQATTVSPSSTSVSGQTLSGAISVDNAFGLVFNGTNWFAEPTFDITGQVSFTELTAQFVIPAGVTLPLTDASFFALSRYFTSSNPGTIVTLAPVSVPEPATLALIGAGFAGIGFARRSTRRDH